MSLKSLVNKSIIKSDLRRFWYIGALFMGAILLTLTIPVIDMTKYREVDTELMNRFWSYTNNTIPVFMLFGIITPAVLFSYLHKRSAVCAIHSLPLKRESVFFSHIISSVILLLIPLVLNVLILLSINRLYSPDIMLWLGLSVVYCVLFTGMSIFSSAIAGNVFAAMAIPGIVMLLPIYTASIIEELASKYLFGYSNMGGISLMNVVDKWYLSFNDLKSINSLIYIALGVVLCAIGFICYKKRALENNSSVTAFSILNPVFMYGVALFGGFLGMAYIDAILDVFSLWIAVPFGIIGIIIAKMLINKTFKPQKIVKPAFVYVAMIAVIYVLVGFDITGYEKRIPDVSDIASVNVVGNNEHTEYGYYGDEKLSLAPEAQLVTEITDKSDIEKVLALHTSLTEPSHTGITKRDFENATTLSVKYTLKNGKVFVRNYVYQATPEQQAMYNDIQNTPIVKAYRYPVLADVERDYVSARVDSCSYGRRELSAEQIAELKQALRDDISKISITELDGETVTKINFTVVRPMVNASGERVDMEQNWRSITEDYYVRDTYTNTVKLLKEWGLYKVMPKPSEVKSIRLSEVNRKDYSLKSETWAVEPAQIQKLLDYIYNNENELGKGDGTYSIDINYQDNSGWSTTIKKLPEI